MTNILKPKQLRSGDTIGLISNSSPLAGMLRERVEQGIKMLEKMGFRVLIGKNALKVNSYVAGSAEDRANDINSFFKNKEVKAIISFIGGFHSNQILNLLDYKMIRKNPKIFMGFSDTTVLDIALYKKIKLVTFYGPAILTQFSEYPKIYNYTKSYFNKAVTLSKPIGMITKSSFYTDDVLDWFQKKNQFKKRRIKKNNEYIWIKKGRAKGIMLGGCITSLMHLRGTEYWPNLKNSLFFWEIPEGDSIYNGESLENIDSYLTDLELSGVFKQINGMIIGKPYRYSKKEIIELINIIKIRTKNYKFPILFNVNFGHTDPIITIPIGVKGLLNSSKNCFSIIESGTK